MLRMLAGTVAYVVVLMVPGLLTAQAPRPAIRDSAGVQIVAYDSTIIPPRFELRDRGLDIGSDAGSELVRVRNALRMPDGVIIVGDAGRQHLIRFTPDGELDKVIGREGRGPGEFGRLTWMGRHGRDVIGTYDGSLVRYSVFSDSGFLRQVRLQRSDHVWQAEMLPVGVAPGGDLVITAGAAFSLGAEGPARVERKMNPLVQYHADGTPGRLLGRYPGIELEVSVIREGPLTGGFQNGVRTFGRNSASGMIQGHIVAVDNDRFQFDVIDTAGRLIRRVRRAHVNQPVRASHFEAYVREQLEGVRAEHRESRRQYLEGHPHSATFPALEARLVIDAVDRIWIGEYRRPGDREQTWWMFTIDGRMTGHVRVPANLTITDAGTDWVLGVWRDEDGVQTVRLYDLRPVTGRG
jgi:hypothetical protein